MSKTPTKRPTKKPTRTRTASPRKKTQRRDPLKLIRIGITPPSKAEDAEAQRVDARLANKATRPGPSALSKLPWLRQDLAYRIGYYMLTHGLREHADHLEFEVCNVPGAYVRETQRMLNHIADYVLNSGRAIKPGETMQVSSSDDSLMAIVSFRLIQPGEGGMDHERDVLRLVFLH